jgi:hypothetical protein
VGKAEQRRQDKARAIERAAERRRVALRVYQGCDEAGTRKLAELAATGVTPTCAAGCSHCCSLEIPISRAEAEAIVEWLMTNRRPEDLAGIRDRLRGWLAWYRTEYPRLVASGVSRIEAFFRHAPRCALLENERCGAYPVRPVTCRNHYVSSPASACDPASGAGADAAEPLLAVARATHPNVVELQRVVEGQGGDYLASIHLIAEWLAHLLEVEREPWHGASRLLLS